MNKKIIIEKMDPCLDPTWRDSGFTEKYEYRFWSRRTCGIACLESILDYSLIEHENRRSMITDSIKYGAYIKTIENQLIGLIYNPFCKLIFEKYDIESEIYEHKSLEYVAGKISESCMAISSVSTEIRSPERPNHRKGGHLILIHGADMKNIWFHNPSGIPPFQNDACLSIKDAERFHANRGILIKIRNSTNNNLLDVSHD